MSGVPVPPSSQTLLAAWHDSSHEKPRLLLLEGAAGIGKSHSLRTFAASGQNALVLSTACTGWLAAALRTFHARLESERDPSFLQAARSLTPDLAWAQVAHAPALTDQNALWMALAQAFERLARRSGGLILLLEDAHDAGADDLGALRVLYRRALLAKAPILIALSARPPARDSITQDLLEGFGQDAAIADGLAPERLRLLSLDLNGVTALLREHLHSDFLPDDLASWLHVRAEGHPLHTLELLRFLRDGGALQDSGAGWMFERPSGKGIPRTLEAVLLSRLTSARRGQAAWRALSALCVLGREVSLRDWATLCGLDRIALLEAAHRLEHLGLLRESLAAGKSEYAVAHPLYPALVRAQLEPDDLERLHRRAVGIAHNIGECARHAWACGHERRLEWTFEALENAQKRFAHGEVIGHAQRLLEVAPDHVQVRRWNLALGEALLAQGELEPAARVLEGVLSETVLPESVLPETVLPESVLPETVLPETIDGPDAVWLYARTLNALGRYAETVDLVRSLPDPNVTLRVQALRALRGLERGTESEALFQTLHGLVEHGSAAWSDLLEERCDTLHILRDYGPACQIAEELLKHHQTSGDGFRLAGALTRAGRSESLRSLEAGEPLLRQALILAEQNGSLALIMTASARLGVAFYNHGEYVRAHPLLRKSMNAALASKNLDFAFGLTRNLALNEFYRGETDRALVLFERAIELVADRPGMYSSDAQLYYAEKHAMLGRPERGLELLAKHDYSNLGAPGYGAGTILLIAGQPERARAVLDWPVFEQHTDYEHARTSNVRALSHAMQEDWTQAELEFAQALEFAAKSVKKPLKLEMQLGLNLSRHRANPSQATALEVREVVTGLELLGAHGHLLTLERLFPELNLLRQDSGNRVLERTSDSMLNLELPGIERCFLRTLGSFALERDGQTTILRDSKARDLLAHLLVALLREDGPGIPRTQLIDAIWPESGDPEALEMNFRVTLKRLREKLGDAASVSSRDGIYELRNLNADVTHFLHSLERLDFEAALGWYKGEFLPNIDVIDAEIVRAQLWQRFRDTALQSSLEQPAAVAADLLEKLHRLEPLDVTLLERLTSTLRTTNDPYRLEQTLSRARTIFERETGEIPVELLLLERA
jgi:tetratricopeptide (TPR) repeat protein